jgi:hypothetical protein
MSCLAKGVEVEDGFPVGVGERRNVLWYALQHAESVGFQLAELIEPVAAPPRDDQLVVSFDQRADLVAVAFEGRVVQCRIRSRIHPVDEGKRFGRRVIFELQIRHRQFLSSASRSWPGA